MSGIYEKAIVDHAKSPRNFGALAGANRSAQGSNPLCGDEIAVHLRVEGDRIEAASFEGAGCAVCLASASMMTLSVSGTPRAAAVALMQRVGEAVAGGDAADLGDLAALSGVARFPARQKCALLPWRALEQALGGRGGVVSTEL